MSLYAVSPHTQRRIKMKKVNIKKLAVAGIFCAVAVVGSLFSFPVFGSKCAPVQHLVNILCAVLLGPAYGVGVAFCASLIRNVLALGSLMAFPGSMIGALLCGVVYKKTKNIPATLVGEVFGTGILGGLCAYPVAVLFMGKGGANISSDKKNWSNIAEVMRDVLDVNITNEQISALKGTLSRRNTASHRYIQSPGRSPSARHI